jgi:nucleotide-binding universal stress UspA family protein
MFRSVVVPLDGSAFGEQALPPAVAVARATGAALRLVHKHVPPAPIHPDGALARDSAISSRSRALEWTYLEQAAGRAAAGGGLAVSTDLVEGPTVEALCGAVREAAADLVVLTTHGRGPLSRFWLGSVADALVRQLTVPVLLVRPTEEEDGPAPEGLRVQNLLVPLDGSPYAEAALAPALTLGRSAGAVCTLLRVVGHEADGPEGPGQLREEARAYLEGLAGRLREQGHQVRTRLHTHRSPAAAILEEAACGPYDLVALATHGRGGLARLLLGSVADKVIRGATIPVLVCRPAERGKET